jgi:hypothetical protein
MTLQPFHKLIVMSYRIGYGTENIRVSLDLLSEVACDPARLSSERPSFSTRTLRFVLIPVHCQIGIAERDIELAVHFVGNNHSPSAPG